MKKTQTKEIGPERLLRLSEVLARIPISKTTWWEGVRTGKYPKPVKLGERLTCWRLMDILELVERGVDWGSPKLRKSTSNSRLQDEGATDGKR